MPNIQGVQGYRDDGAWEERPPLEYYRQQAISHPDVEWLDDMPAFQHDLDKVAHEAWTVQFASPWVPYLRGSTRPFRHCAGWVADLTLLPYLEDDLRVQYQDLLNTMVNMGPLRLGIDPNALQRPHLGQQWQSQPQYQHQVQHQPQQPHQGQQQGQMQQRMQPPQQHQMQQGQQPPMSGGLPPQASPTAPSTASSSYATAPPASDFEAARDQNTVPGKNACQGLDCGAAFESKGEHNAHVWDRRNDDAHRGRYWYCPYPRGCQGRWNARLWPEAGTRYRTDQIMTHLREHGMEPEERARLKEEAIRATVEAAERLGIHHGLPPHLRTG